MSVAAATGGGLCAVPFTQIPNLSHESLIRRAASLVTDGSSTFLSQSTLALIDAMAEYSKAVHTLVALQKRYLASLGSLSQTEEEDIWQVMIGQRAKVSDRQEECKRFEAVWSGALRLCETAAEAAYISDACLADNVLKKALELVRAGCLPACLPATQRRELASLQCRKTRLPPGGAKGLEKLHSVQSHQPCRCHVPR
ncbi:diablo IAP-binding mitochondrial protein isoform X3 [Syngnathus scovelli]|nr:diablo IAP-binding mitochondrial protein isoform X3 [Syngnathus scovelli]